MKYKHIILALFIMLAVAGAARYVYYGSVTRDCIYTEAQFPVLEDFVNSTVIVVQEAIVAEGVIAEELCAKKFGSITKRIVGPEFINNPTIGTQYYVDKGLKVSPLKEGAKFKMISSVAVKKHGISAIDADSVVYYLILEDEIGAQYKIATVALGFSNQNLFLALSKDATIEDRSAWIMLEPHMFKPG